MVFATLVGVWIAVGVSHREIAWQGKRLRLYVQLEQFDVIVQSLREDWPREDGQHERLGPYMAYPFGQPRTLMLLAPPQVSPTGTTVAAVEKLRSGGLSFQLSGTEQGDSNLNDWLEWLEKSNGRPELTKRASSDS